MTLPTYSMKTKSGYIRFEAKGIPHTKEPDLELIEETSTLKVFSGHVPIALQTLTLLFIPLDEYDRAFLWKITHDLIEEAAQREGWLYSNQELLREWTAEDEADPTVLNEYEASANRVVDTLWVYKTLIQESGVDAFLEIANKLDETESIYLDTMLEALEQHIGEELYVKS